MTNNTSEMNGNVISVASGILLSILMNIQSLYSSLTFDEIARVLFFGILGGIGGMMGKMFFTGLWRWVLRKSISQRVKEAINNLKSKIKR